MSALSLACGAIHLLGWYWGRGSQAVIGLMAPTTAPSIRPASGIGCWRRCLLGALVATDLRGTLKHGKPNYRLWGVLLLERIAASLQFDEP